MDEDAGSGFARLSEPADASAVMAPPAKNTRQFAFKALYERYFPKLVAGLRAVYGAGPPDPDDVAQAAFEKLSARQTLEDIQDAEGFVWIAARNIVMSAKRAERVCSGNKDEVERRFFGQSCDTFDPERVLMARQQLSVVMESLRQMPERRRRIFILNRFHGLTPEKAGASCGVSRSSAVRHIALATAAIAQALADGDAANREAGS